MIVIVVVAVVAVVVATVVVVIVTVILPEATRLTKYKYKRRPKAGKTNARS